MEATTTTETPHEDPEITLAQAKVDQAPDEPTPAGQGKKDQGDIVDTLRPKAKSVVRTLGKDDMAREYIQRPLSFIGKMQWFSLIGSVLDKAMGGDNALTVNNLLSAPGTRGGVLRPEDFRDADTFIHAISKLLMHAPEFLEDSFCIWLGIPDFEQTIAKQLMVLAPEDGGLSDEEGMDIIATFIDQNYDALDAFFRERLGQLQSRVAKRVEEAQRSRQSKR